MYVQDMRLLLSVSDGEGSFSDLFEWIRAEAASELRPTAVPPAPKANEMGALHDTISVLLGAGGAKILADVLKTWIESRAPHAKIRVAIDDSEVEVEVSGSATHEEIVESIERLIRRPEPPTAP